MPTQIIEHGEKLDVISRTTHPMGEVIHMAERTAVLMTYFRNNILHLLAVAGVGRVLFHPGTTARAQELQRLIRLIYPFMKKELNLKWKLDEIDDVTSDAIRSLIDLEILTYGELKTMLVRPPAGSEKAFQLLMLGQSMVPMLQRFYLVIAILVSNGSGSAVAQPSRDPVPAKCRAPVDDLRAAFARLLQQDVVSRFHSYAAGSGRLAPQRRRA